MKLRYRVLLFILIFVCTPSFCFPFEEDFEKIQRLERVNTFNSENTRDETRSLGFKEVTRNGLKNTQNTESPSIFGYFDMVFEADSKVDDIIRYRPQDPAASDIYEESRWTLLNTLKLNVLTMARPDVEAKISALARLETMDIEDNKRPETAQKTSIKDMYLDESYVRIFLPNSEFQAGLLNFDWGTVEENSPLDRINPENMFRYMTVLKPERKLPVPAASFHFAEELYSFDAFFGLYRRGNRDPDHDSEWLPANLKNVLIWQGRNLTTILDERPEYTLKNNISGGRLIRHGEKYLAGLSYVNSWDYDNQYIGSDYRVLTGENIPLFTHIINKPVSIVGIFAESSWNEIELRADFSFYEKAYYRDKYKSPLEDDNLYPKKKIAYVLEAAHNFDESSRLLLQYMHDYIINWDDTVDFPESEQRVYIHLIHELKSKSLTFDLRFIQNYTFDEFYFRPRVIWKLGNIVSEFGADFLWGETKSRGFGQFDDNDQFLMKFRYNF